MPLPCVSTALVAKAAPFLAVSQVTYDEFEEMVIPIPPKRHEMACLCNPARPQT